MDLFAAVAQRIENSPPEVRPVVLTPFEAQRQAEDFEIEEREIEAPPAKHLPSTANQSAEQIEQPQSQKLEVVPQAERAPTSGIESLNTQAISSVEQESSKGQSQPQVLTQTSETTNSYQEANVQTPHISESQVPLERLIEVKNSSESPELQTTKAEPQEATEPTKTSLSPLVNNQFVTEIEATSVEHKDISIQNIEIGGDSITNQSSTTINQEGPRIVIPVRPIEVALHSTVNNTQLISEAASQPFSSDAASEREPAPSSVIDIRIGRIEVNALKSQSPGKRVATSAPTNNRLSLEDILQKRGRT